MADPTLELKRKLKDSSLWEIRRNVPVFKPHRRKDKDGKEIRVDEDRLRRIVETVREAEEESEVIPRLSIGHIEAGKGEKEQPEFVGYAWNWRVGAFGKRKTPCILADLYIRKDKYQAVKDGDYLYRSVEFYPPSNEITGVALLKRDPQLDLGVLTYDRPNGAYCYAMGDATVADELDTDDPTGRPKAPPPGKGPDDEPEDDDDDPAAGLDDSGKAILNACSKMMKKYFKKYAMPGPAYPGPTSGQLPLPPGARPEEDRQNMQRQGAAVRATRAADDKANSALAVRLQQLEQTVAEQTKQIQYQRDRNAQSEADMIVAGLVKDDYVVPDPEALVRKLAGMKGGDERLEYEREYRAIARRAPTGDNWHPATAETYARQSSGGARDDGAGEGAEDNFTQRDLEKAEAYMRRNPGCEWEEAEEYAKGKRSLNGQPLAAARS